MTEPAPQCNTWVDGLAEPLRLPAHCTIREIGEIRNLFAPQLLATGAVQVDAHAVGRLDTAALQVFAAFARDRAEKGLVTTWSGCGENFARAVRLLGLESVISLSSY
jgi:phospholipid transport system transporter-binding protein